MKTSRRTFSLALLAAPSALLAAPSALLAAPSALASGGDGTHARPRALDHAAMRKALRRIHETNEDHAARSLAISTLFLGKAYRHSPLGEGPDGDRDTDPIVDFEHFDCVTYAEEVMALAWHAQLDEAIARLQHIRYTHGRIDYGHRKHIMMAQWIPQNIAAGFVTDITRALAPRRASVARLELTDAHFESKKGKALRLAEDERPLGTHRVPIVAPNVLSGLGPRLPHGTLITTIRAARTHVPYRASHVGLIVERDGQRFVRHAHRGSAQVIEDSIARFIRRARGRSAWKVSGFNLLRIATRAPST